MADVAVSFQIWLSDSFVVKYRDDKRMKNYVLQAGEFFAVEEIGGIRI